MRRFTLASALIGMLTMGLVPAAALAATPSVHPAPHPHVHHDDPDSRVHHPRYNRSWALAKLKRATAKYRDVKVAEAHGYVSTKECSFSPEGAMGIHYVNQKLVEDPAVRLTQPEVLLYLPTKHGYRFLGVEYFVVDDDQNLKTKHDRPWVPGLKKKLNGPMKGHGPGMPIHYDLHVWTRAYNPSGLFADWNPNVHCPKVKKK